MGPVSRWREQRRLKRIAGGDRAAADQLVDEHYEGAYRWMLYLCRDREAAADLTQETFLQVWQGLDGFGGFSSLRTWIHRIAYYTYLRAERGSPPRSAPLPDALNGGGLTDAVLTRCALEDALAQLPQKQRQVVALHYLQGFTSAEIAEVLEIPAGTVLSRLHTARERLRGLLADEVFPAKQELKTNVEQD